MSGIAHLYLHTPYCRRICHYCHYAAEVAGDREGVLGEWEAALRGELDLRGGTAPVAAGGGGVDGGDLLARPLRTLYVGGGTPSLLGSGAMAAVRRIVGGAHLDGIEEWTAEANPEDLTSELLDAWREAGVTRLGLGLQSVHGPALAWLGRVHDPDIGARALSLVARSGFPSWNVDLLFGLPREIDPDPLESARAAVAAGAPHISIYELVEAETASDDEIADQFLLIHDLLAAEGYEGYEMTSFARPGHHARHTVATLEGKDLLGLGPGAESRIGGRSSWNLRDWREYSERVARGDLLRQGEAAESEPPGGVLLMSIWSRLKLRAGLPASELSAKGHHLAMSWVNAGWARIEKGCVSLTPEGWLRLDRLALDMTRAEEGS